MAINLLEALDSAGEFRSAIFLTYTLNLQFFEQMIAPRLDAAGCTNVLILSDTTGYDEALLRGARSLSGAGTRYVCARLRSLGHGVQHTKLVLLAGPQAGRLLVGSGNLTLQGFGRNLELFDRYDLDLDAQPVATEAEHYPFYAIWQLIQRIHKYEADLPAAVGGQLQTILQTSPWLQQPVMSPNELQLWHNYDRPLFDRIAELEPVEELQIIAPFFDLMAIQALVKHLRPQRLVVGVDAFHPNLDGPTLAARCRTWGCELAIRAFDGQSLRRPLHAKAIVGIDTQGVWWIAGSANCTRPALLGSWRQDGNLELVSWKRVSERSILDTIWQDDQLAVQTRDPASLLDTSVESDNPTPIIPPLDLLELSYQQRVIRGRVRFEGPASEETVWALELLRGYEQIPFKLKSDGSFTVQLSRPLQSVEAARVLQLVDGTVVTCSAYVWIDQPAELARYAQRAFYVHVQEGIKTFDGAGKLFEELMNFLWQRADPRTFDPASGELAAFRVRGRHTPQQTEDDGPPPPASAFIVDDDMVHRISQRIAGTMGHERSTLSLQDLLSLVLLRLTVRTVPGTPDVAEGSQPDVERDVVVLADHEERQRAAMAQIRAYLLRYSRNYALRLGDEEFVAAAGAERLFENQVLLGRVLLEVADKCGTEVTPDAVFSRSDFQRCALLMLSGMFWPAGAELDGTSAWDLLSAQRDPVQLPQMAEKTELLVIVAELIARAWGEAPTWQRGMINPTLVQEYLGIQALLHRIEQRLGQRFWSRLSDMPVSTLSLLGFRRLADVEHESRQAHVFQITIARLDRLASYRTPVEEKFAPLLAWWSSPQHLLPPPLQIAREYPREVELLRTRPKARVVALVEGTSHCPACFRRLAQAVQDRLRRGNLEMCNNCRNAMLYWKPTLRQ